MDSFPAAAGALLSGILSIGSAAAETAPPRQIFILAGQSNMSVRGEIAEVPAFKNAARVFVYGNAGQWQPGREPVDDPAGQVDHVSRDGNAKAGPGMAFADRYAELRACVEVGLVPAAKGATDIDAWKRDLSRETLYGSMIARAREAAEHGEIAGLLWYQGERDSNDPELTRAWPAKFAALVADVRKDLAIEFLPTIVTVLGPKRSERFLGWDAFVSMQMAMDLPPRVVRVSANDLQGVAEEAHLTTADYVLLGQRYAEAMAELVGSRCSGD